MRDCYALPAPQSKSRANALISATADLDVRDLEGVALDGGRLSLPILELPHGWETRFSYKLESSTQPEKVRVPFIGGGISMRAMIQAAARNLRFCFVR